MQLGCYADNKEPGGYQVLEKSEKRPVVMRGRVAFKSWRRALELPVAIRIIIRFHRRYREMAALYRADHVGSFLRPPELLEARSNAAKDPLRLRSLEDLHIQRVLAKQKELGYEGLRGCAGRSEEHTSELQSRSDLVCRLLLEKKTIPIQAEQLQLGSSTS